MLLGLLIAQDLSTYSIPAQCWTDPGQFRSL